jgi:hypothetical protein
MDDEVSRDHHWGPRVDILLPDSVFRERGAAVQAALREELPREFRGFRLEAGHVGAPGLALESAESFLSRTIGITRAPRSDLEWLEIPEEDLVHVTNGEIWHDPSGTFIALRAALAYYPDTVWKRRIAHWCRYCSGMGLYALKRAVLRDNPFYATTAFARTVKLSMELAFLLNRQYFPYDKWLYEFFRRLPALAPELDPLLCEAVALATSWERRLELLGRVADLLDARMVELELVPPHPPLVGSPTSGYRLLEHAYAVILRDLPPEVVRHVPLWDQKYLEQFHSAYVVDLPLDEWHALLGLRLDERPTTNDHRPTTDDRSCITHDE